MQATFENVMHRRGSPRSGSSDRDGGHVPRLTLETQTVRVFHGGVQCEAPEARLPECAGMSLVRAVGLGDVLDHLDEFVDGVSLAAGELDEFADLLHDGAAFGCPGDRDSAAAAELE